MNVNEIFFDFQCWYDNCSLVGKSGVNFLVIVRCDEFFQKKTSYYILLSVCIVFFDRSFVYLCFFFISNVRHLSMERVHMHVVYLIE